MRLSLLLILFLPIFAYSKMSMTWDENYGEAYNEGANQVLIDSDGSMLIAGWENKNDGAYQDILLLKLNSSGTQLWQINLGGPLTDEVYDITAFGDYYLLAGVTEADDVIHGDTGKDIYFAIIDRDGEIISEQVIFRAGNQIAKSIQVIDTNEFWLLGYTDVYGNRDVLLKSITFSGSGYEQYTEDDRIYGNDQDEFGDDLIVKDNGDWLFCSSVYSGSSSDFDVWIAYNGMVSNWEKAYGSDYAFSCESLVECADGGFLVVGDSWSYNDENRNVWLSRFDSSGNLLWANAYDEGQIDGGNAAVQCADGGFIVAAMTISLGITDWWVFKVSAEGELLWSKVLGGNEYDYLRSIAVVEDGLYLLVGTSSSFSESGLGDSDILLLKFKDLP